MENWPDISVGQEGAATAFCDLGTEAAFGMRLCKCNYPEYKTYHKYVFDESTRPLDKQNYVYWKI